MASDGHKSVLADKGVEPPCFAAPKINEITPGRFGTAVLHRRSGAASVFMVSRKQATE